MAVGTLAGLLALVLLAAGCAGSPATAPAPAPPPSLAEAKRTYKLPNPFYFVP